MNIIIYTAMIICLIFSLLVLVSDVTGTFFIKLIVKLIAVIGVLFPILYFLKINNVI